MSEKVCQLLIIPVERYNGSELSSQTANETRQTCAAHHFQSLLETLFQRLQSRLEGIPFQLDHLPPHRKVFNDCNDPTVFKNWYFFFRNGIYYD